MASTYTVVRASVADSEAIAACRHRAWENDIVTKLLFPAEKAHLTSPEELKQFRLKRSKKHLSDPDVVWYKAVLNSDPNSVIGYAAWTKPRSRKREAESKAKSGQQTVSHGVAEQVPAQRVDDDLEFPACMDVEAEKLFKGRVEEKRKEIWGENDDYWYLAGLTVDPAHQRKGVATALLRPGLQQVDSDRLPAYLEATRDGAYLYPRVGFEYREALDMVPPGHKFHHQVDIMVRPVMQG